MAKKKEKKKDVVKETEYNRFDFVYGEAIDFTPEEQNKLVEKYHKLIGEDLSARKDRQDEWDQDTYILSTKRSKEGPWANSSKVAIGTAAEMVDDISENITTRVYSGNRVWNLQGIDDYSLVHEEAVENWLNCVTDTEEEYKFTEEEIKAMVTDDSELSLVSMERVETIVKKWQKLGVFTKIINKIVNIIGNYEIIEKKVVEVKHVSKVIKKEDVIVPGNATNDIQKNQHIGYFFQPTLAELKAKNAVKEYYLNLDQLEGKEEVQDEDNETKKTEQEEKVQVKNTVPELKVAVLFVKEDINEDGVLEDIILIFNYPTKTFMRGQYIQYFHGKRPLIYNCAYPDRDKYSGISFVSQVRALQLEIESMIDQTSDNWDLCIKKIFTKLVGAKITIGNEKGDDNEIFPGSMITVTGKDDINVLNVGSVDYNSLPLINKFESIIYRRVGLGGGIDTSDPRASGKKVGMLLSQGSIKIDGVFKRYNNSKASYAKMLISLYAQYGDEALKYKVWDDKKKTFVIMSIDREILQNINVKVTFNGLQFNTSKEQEKQEELFMYETLLKNPLLSMTPMQLSQYSRTQLESLMAITKQLFEKYGKYNKERLLPSIDELGKSIQQQVAMVIEAKLKEEAKAALNAPKARPDELEKVAAMADKVQPNDLVSGGPNG